MTTFDPSVWTSDLPSVPGFYFVRGSGPMEFKVNPNGVVSFGPDEREMLWSYAASHGAARSIHAIPFAEEIAALVGLERAVLDAVTGAPTSQPERYEGDNHGDSFSSGWDSGEFSMAKKLRAALARLDAARKERGA